MSDRRFIARKICGSKRRADTADVASAIYLRNRLKNMIFSINRGGGPTIGLTIRRRKGVFGLSRYAGDGPKLTRLRLRLVFRPSARAR